MQSTVRVNIISSPTVQQIDARVDIRVGSMTSLSSLQEHSGVMPRLKLPGADALVLFSYSTDSFSSYVSTDLCMLLKQSPKFICLWFRPWKTLSMHFFSRIPKRFVYYYIKKKSLNVHTTRFYRASKEVDLKQP